MSLNVNKTQLNSKVEHILADNKTMVLSVKRLIKEIDEHKKQCDVIQVLGVGAAIFGSILKGVAIDPDQIQSNQFLKNTGELTETIGNAAKTGVKLFDNFKSKALLLQIQSMAQQYGEKSQLLQSELDQFSSIQKQINRIEFMEVRGNSSIDLSELTMIVMNHNINGIVGKTKEMFELIENSTECHPIVSKLEELLEKLESDSERMVRIRDIISDSYTNPKTERQIQLLNRLNESDSHYDEDVSPITRFDNCCQIN